jgi:predicted SAM-dependent methyltransferase
MKIIVGAGNTNQEGWLSLQHQHLDIRNPFAWQQIFQPNSLEAILSEHVLEHLTLDEAAATAQNIRQMLQPNGYWRIAVPDGFHPSENYIDWVAPDSSGERLLAMFRDADEPNHKLLWNYKMLSQFLTDNGFGVVLREWFDELGYFHKAEWSELDGKIHRCAGSSWSSFLSFITSAPYTSLIVDAVKIERGITYGKL